MEGKIYEFLCQLRHSNLKIKAQSLTTSTFNRDEFLEGNLRNCECTNRQAYQNQALLKFQLQFIW